MSVWVPNNGKELGAKVGSLDYGAASEAIRRTERRIKSEHKWKERYIDLQASLMNI